VVSQTLPSITIINNNSPTSFILYLFHLFGAISNPFFHYFISNRNVGDHGGQQNPLNSGSIISNYRLAVQFSMENIAVKGRILCEAYRK
jgi:hypothetical protein